MGWPKGLSRKPGLVYRRENGLLKVLPVEPTSIGPISGGGFIVGQWYLYHGKPEVVINEFGHVQKWSVIKFEVVKYTDAIMAVRFEDGSFEAVVNPKSEDFSSVQAPRY